MLNTYMNVLYNVLRGMTTSNKDRTLAKNTP